jgi:hypothetical protein
MNSVDVAACGSRLPQEPSSWLWPQFDSHRSVNNRRCPDTLNGRKQDNRRFYSVAQTPSQKIHHFEGEIQLLVVITARNCTLPPVPRLSFNVRGLKTAAGNNHFPGKPA